MKLPYPESDVAVLHSRHPGFQISAYGRVGEPVRLWAACRWDGTGRVESATAQELDELLTAPPVTVSAQAGSHACGPVREG